MYKIQQVQQKVNRQPSKGLFFYKKKYKILYRMYEKGNMSNFSYTLKYTFGAVRVKRWGKSPPV